MYCVENCNEYGFAITANGGHDVARVERLGRRVEGDDAAGWAVSRGLPMEHHTTDEQWQRIIDLAAAAPQMLAAIDQVAAALETCMAHYGNGMCEADRRSRTAAIAAARKAQANAEGYKTWADAVSAACGE